MAEEFARAIERARPHIQTVMQILEEEGLPPELAAIPFVESMFNPKAYSFRGAAGLWQLMPRTARELKLKVTRDVDQRRSLEHSTRAAARLLKKNYKMLKSWPLAITAYNHGPYGIQRAVRKIGSNKLPDLITHYKTGSWGFSSKNFYVEVVAIIKILKEKSLLP